MDRGEDSRGDGKAEGGKKTLEEGEGMARKVWGLECAAFIPIGGHCENEALIECEICRLVAYCTEECKKNHSALHETECPPRCIPPSTSEPTAEIPDHPVFDTGVFWANYAATDILNLAENEGPEYNGPLRILLLGTFGLRHLIYSVDAMPRTASPSLEVTISEMEPPHLYRTLLSLLILLKGEDDNPFNIAEMVIHVWYSYKWPDFVRSYIDDKLGDILLDLSKSVKAHYADGKYPGTHSLGVKWGHLEYLRLEVSLDRLHWNEMLRYAEIPVCNEDTDLIRAIDVSRYGEPLDRAFARMSPSRVAAMLKWRQDGILLPHGDSSSPYTHLNSIFFPKSRSPPGGITNEPLSEWSMNRILDYTPYPAKDDVYGKMIVYVRDMLKSFQLRLKENGIQIKLMAHGTTEMLGYIPRHFDDMPCFDRIEVGHLFDIDPQLCLLSCSLLLRHQDENPFATMLAMTRESVIQSGSPNIEKIIAAEKHNLYHPVFEPLDAITPPAQAIVKNYSAACVPRHLALLLYRNWDLFSDRHLSDANVFGFQVPEDEVSHNPEKSQQPKPKRSVLQTGYLGLQLKPKNKVTVRWPNRLVYGKSSNPTKEEVMRWMSWSTTKPERWLEWKKVRDVGYTEWAKYFVMIEGERATRDWDRHYGYITAEDELERENRGNAIRGCKASKDADGAQDENPIPDKVNEDENDDWMLMDTPDSKTTSRQDGKAKKSKKNNNSNKKKKK
ncbi:hypothetical protein V8C37DRAFT_416589 [Trichoderma ceciliae]